jgi:hypothetical protein
VNEALWERLYKYAHCYRCHTSIFYGPSTTHNIISLGEDEDFDQEDEDSD